MKRLLILTIIFVTVVLAGALYGGFSDNDTIVDVTIAQAYMQCYPEIVPTIVPAPITELDF